MERDPAIPCARLGPLPSAPSPLVGGLPRVVIECHLPAHIEDASWSPDVCDIGRATRAPCRGHTEREERHVSDAPTGLRSRGIGRAYSDMAVASVLVRASSIPHLLSPLESQARGAEQAGAEPFVELGGCRCEHKVHRRTQLSAVFAHADHVVVTHSRDPRPCRATADVSESVSVRGLTEAHHRSCGRCFGVRSSCRLMPWNRRTARLVFGDSAGVGPPWRA
jgi:hypothetical protein